MENKNKNKKIAIYIAVLIALLGGSFIIYKIASAAIDNSVISEVELTSIVTGTNIDPEGTDSLQTTCNDGVCTSTYTASKDSSSDNILVKSFDKITYNFKIDVKDSTDPQADVEDVKVNLRVTLNGDDSKYVSLTGNECNDGVCVIDHVSSFETTYYSLTLNVNNAPNGYEIHPTFAFDVEENNNDTPIALGYNEASETTYYYSYNSTNGTYKSVGPANYMPTIVSSAPVAETYTVVGENTFTQAANYEGQDGRFITYLLGIKLNTPAAGSYYENDEITLNTNFTQTGSGEPIVNENWIRLYGTDMVDGIKPVTGSVPYSTSSVGEASKYIKNPGNLTVTQEDGINTIKISGFNLLLDAPTMNADNSGVDGHYIATIALTNFSPRLESDGQADIINTLTVLDINNAPIGTKSIANTYGQVSGAYNDSDSQADILTSSAWYDESEKNQLSNVTSGAVSKGSIIKYITKFKSNKTSNNQTLKEVIKFDLYAYRVLPYDETSDIKITVKCGNSECDNISKNDFEVKFVTGSFDNAGYEINDIANSKLSDNDKVLAATCEQYSLDTLNRDQIQNLYGGPCIKAKDGFENIYDKIDDASKIEGDTEVENPITKVIVQTKDGKTLPNGAEVIVTVKARVRNVPDLTQLYQATTMISSSDYDSKLYYYAPQIKERTNYINNALADSNYIKGSAEYQYIGDALRIVSFTLRQNISVTNQNSDGSMKTKYKTANNETITYKVETNLVDNGINVGEDDTWYIRQVKVYITLPSGLEYIPDDDLIAPISVSQNGNNTVLEYLIVTPNDKIKSNMKINDIYFKAKLDPTLSGKAVEMTVISYPFAENINGEIDRTVGDGAKFKIYATGINEVIASETIGESGSLIEKNGTIDYVLNAYNNVGENIDDYTIVDVLPYTGDENGSDFTGSYSVKVTSSTVGLQNIECTSEVPSKIKFAEDSIWDNCVNIASEYKDDVTAIRIKNISIANASYMGEIVISLKTKDNNASDKYNNKFYGFTEDSENNSNIIEASVISRTISGHAFLDNTGNSVKDGNETYVKDIPVTLYKVDSEGILKNVADTVTDENGYYEFNNLEKGRYKIRAKYDITKYDLALRYATEDVNKDSDAYLIDTNGTIEISDKSETSKGLVLYPPVNSISDMDIGLQPKHTFGFTMSKYITKIDLTNNGLVTTNTYDNLSTVSLSVMNPNKYTTKVYYGIAITNDSNKSGYINLVKEDIPQGFIFDKNYPENAGWFELDGMVGNRTLEDRLVNPGETVYLQIALFLPARDEAGTFVNTASVAEVTEYNPIVKNISENEYVNEDQFVVGDSIRYAGVNFHVIGVIPDGSEQIVTLLADANQVTNMTHGTEVYKWSTSNINYYLNNSWIINNNIDSSKLIGFNICDDASGLLNASANGGIVDSPLCASGIYTSSKVRLLNQAEYDSLLTNVTDASFLGGGNFWLMDAVYATTNDNSFDAYGNVLTSYNTSNLAKYVNTANSTVLPVQGTSGYDKDNIENITSNLQVRPVIRISTHNIILE